jgi:hypothetical protein
MTCFGSHFENGRHLENFENAKFYYYYYSLSPFFPRTMNLSKADLRNYWTEIHETWWSYRYMFLVGPKVFNFVVKVVKVINFCPVVPEICLRQVHGPRKERRKRIIIIIIIIIT